jgi:hypothetical protein
MVSINRDEILGLLSRQRQGFCERFDVKDLAIFGSFAQDRQSDSSDLDVLVDFAHKATFDSFMDLKFCLEDLLGLRVDLVTRSALRSELKDAIEKDLIYVS